jgi:hypothetical protein
VTTSQAVGVATLSRSERPFIGVTARAITRLGENTHSTERLS